MPSQLDFNVPPVYDVLVKPKNLTLSDVWIAYWTSFYETLVSYLTQNGILLPQLTTIERNALLAPTNGQMIYNITVDAPQFFQTSTLTWRTFTFV